MCSRRQSPSTPQRSPLPRITSASRHLWGKGKCRRAKSYRAWQTSTEANTALTTDPHVHARKRKILNQAFTEKSVRYAAGFVVQHTERWIDLLAHSAADAPGNDGWSQPRNMSDWNDYLVFDILGDLCFGRSFEIKEPKPNPLRQIPRLVIQHVQLFYPVKHIFSSFQCHHANLSRFSSHRSWISLCGQDREDWTTFSI